MDLRILIGTKLRIFTIFLYEYLLVLFVKIFLLNFYIIKQFVIKVNVIVSLPIYIFLKSLIKLKFISLLIFFCLELISRLNLRFWIINLHVKI